MTRLATITSSFLLWLGPCGEPPADDAQRIPLLGDATFPEGIAAHPSTGELFVGGLASGDIQRVSPDGVAYFKQPHEDGLLNVIGLAVDPARDRLWVCSSSFDDPTVAASLLAFDTTTGALLASFSTPADGLLHFLNDVDVDEAGNAYATDSFAPVVWRVDAELTEITPLSSDPAFVVDPEGFNLNGIAVTPDDLHAIVSVPTLSGTGAKLFRVALDDGAVLEIPVDPAFGGVDGLEVVGATTMLGSGGVPGLHRLTFDAAFTQVEIAALDQFDAELDLPTTNAVLDDRVWVVSSQLDHFVEMFGNEDPPSLPFEIVGVPLAALE